MKDIQCAGFDTLPPMLDRTDFTSWQQCIRLYCQDLSPEDKDRYNGDIRAMNILFQGLPKDIYTLINHYTDAKDIWDDVKMLLEGRQNNGQGNNPRGAGVAGNRGAQNRNLDYFKDKMLLMQAQENGVILDEEQLLFIAGGQDNVVDEDVDERPIHDLALNVDNVFQADDCNACDSDVDEDHDNYQDVVCDHHEVHEMHDDVQPNYVVDSHGDYTSDSNMILYAQYVKDNAVQSYKNKVVNASLSVELATYKEQVELYERRAKFELTEREQKIEEQ
ncbi:hypothetical protein Tco_1284965 [Tanacetum coccineum]